MIIRAGEFYMDRHALAYVLESSTQGLTYVYVVYLWGDVCRASCKTGLLEALPVFYRPVTASEVLTFMEVLQKELTAHPILRRTRRGTLDEVREVLEALKKNYM